MTDELYSHRPVQSDDALDVNLWNTALFLWSVRLWVLMGLVAGSLAGVAVSRLAPTMYESTAIIRVVQRERTLSTLTTPTSTRSIVNMAYSAPAQAKLRQSLQTSGVTTTDLKAWTLTALENPQLSIVSLAARSDSPAAAQASANAWAEVLLREAAGSSLFAPSADATFILTEYPKASAELAEANTRRQEARDRQMSAVATLESKLSLPVKEAQLQALKAGLVDVGRRAVSGSGKDRETASRRAREIENRLSKLSTEVSDARLEVHRLEEQQKTEMAPFDVIVKRAETKLGRLEGSLGDAQIALSLPPPRLTFELRAERPTTSVPRIWVPYASLGAVAGFLIAFVAAWARAHHEPLG